MSNGDAIPVAAPVAAPPRASTVRYKAELRKAIRRKASEPEVNYLNITAMLDIMTIILVFLLKTLGESSGSVPQNKDLMLPKSMIQTQPAQDGVRVTVSKSQVLVGNDKVLDLPNNQSLAQSGVEARHKRGANSLYIVPLGNALASARQVDRALREAKGLDPSSSEAIIIADSTIPYRLFIEVLFTLGQNEFGKYHLMVMQAK
jgi:biopolymer transport protein ExbD